MARFLKSTTDSIGLSPEALHFFGEQKVEQMRLRLIQYSENAIDEQEVSHAQELAPCLSSQLSAWVNVDGLHDLEGLQELARVLEIEPIVLASILDTHARPRVAEFDSCLFISTRMLQYDEEQEEITAENLVLILKENVLITFQERIGDVLEPIRERLRKSRRRIRVSGPDYLACAILDIVIDNYIHVISRLGEGIEALDDVLIKESSSNSLEDINGYKMEINYIRKAVKPCRDMVLSLMKIDSELISDQLSIHLNELKNNIELANESVDNYREILSDQLNIFHTTVAYRLNDILKFLTIFSVIFIPITFIAGVYGTNFDYIPELHYKYSYPLMWLLIIIVVVVMLAFFKRKKWL